MPEKERVFLDKDKDKSIINARKGRSVLDKDKNKSIINAPKGRGVFLIRIKINQ
jgi:hypothetical protein